MFHYSSQYNNGDDASVAEELLSGISELETKCAAVFLAVRDGYFKMDKALSIFGVNEMDYLAYSIYQNSTLLKNATREEKLKEVFKTVVSVFFFDETPKISSEKALRELQALTEQA